MKFINNIKFIMGVALVSLLTISCDRELPYPLEDVKRGVVVDVTRVAGTDGVLSAGSTSGNYKVKLQIPTQQGDYSNLDYVQLLCVYTAKDGSQFSKVIVDKITTFPQELTLNIADVYSKLGKTLPELGEVVQFTTNVVLKDGYTVYGWNEYSGFNNAAMAGWKVDGRDFSQSVRYSVACQLVLDEFVGDVTVTDNFWEDTYTAQVTKKSDTELQVSGVFGSSDTNPIVIKVDPTDHSVSVSKQVIYPSIWGYDNLSVAGTGTVDSCNGSITFNGTFTVDQGGFGTYKIVIKN